MRHLLQIEPDSDEPDQSLAIVYVYLGITVEERRRTGDEFLPLRSLYSNDSYVSQEIRRLQTAIQNLWR